MVKKGKWCLSVVLIMMLFTVPAWGYKITVKNAMTESHQEIDIMVHCGGQFHDFNNLRPGASATYANTDWKTAGLCWDWVQINPAWKWQGCDVTSIASDKTSTKLLAACRDITLIFRWKGSGCGIETEVR